MENYYNSEFGAMEKELYWLKTAAIKSAANIETTAKTVRIDVPLAISSSQTYCIGYVYYKIKCENESIVMVTLDCYHTDIMVEWQTPRINRSLDIVKMRLPDGSIGLEIYANGTTFSTDGTDDLSRLRNGESVIISANLTVRATNNFTLEKVNV